jgi:hypothetical protein
MRATMTLIGSILFLFVSVLSLSGQVGVGGGRNRQVPDNRRDQQNDDDQPPKDFGVVGIAPEPCLRPPRFVREVPPKDINRAIDRGVAYLKQNQNDDGSWTYSGHPAVAQVGTPRGATLIDIPMDAGYTAFAALTLLHCGVPANDPAIRNAAQFVRKNYRDGILTTLNATKIILFLDRLGERADRPIVRNLTQQLISIQWNDGGWKDGGRISDWNSYTDTRNTLMALLGLWVGHRQGVRISAPLARSASRFNEAQCANGGWGFSPWKKSPQGSWTAAALVALALRHGAANSDVLHPRAGSGAAAVPQRALAKVAQDPHVVKGFQYLGQFLNSIVKGDKKWQSLTVTCYSLWYLELAAMTFDLSTIGGQDWYTIGASVLLANQNSEGRWKVDDDALEDTCFALLFLRKANLLPEVTPLLKGIGPNADPKPDPAPAVTPLGSHPPSLESKLAPKRVAPVPPTSIEKQHHQTQVDKLLTKMKASSDFGKDLLIKHWRDGEDPYFTPALAKAIPILSGSLQRKARAALADHCTRLTSAERDEHLHSDDPEIRRAAVLSCAVRDDKSHTPLLIELLQDKEALVSRAAHDALCSLTGKDFGPITDAGQADRLRAAADWKGWYNKQESK